MSDLVYKNILPYMSAHGSWMHLAELTLIEAFLSDIQFEDIPSYCMTAAAAFLFPIDFVSYIRIHSLK